MERFCVEGRGLGLQLLTGHHALRGYKWLMSWWLVGTGMTNKINAVDGEHATTWMTNKNVWLAICLGTLNNLPISKIPFFAMDLDAHRFRLRHRREMRRKKAWTTQVKERKNMDTTSLSDGYEQLRSSFCHGPDPEFANPTPKLPARCDCLMLVTTSACRPKF